MSGATLHRESPRCERCLYSLEGFGDRGRCSECGLTFERTEPAPPTRNERTERLNADLALRRFNGPPTLAQRLAPLLGPAVTAAFVLGVAGTLTWLGWQTIRAIKFKLDWQTRAPRPSTSGSMAAVTAVGDALLFALRCVPYALLALAVAVAFAGLSLRRVPIAPGTTLTGSEARGLGGFALTAAMVLAGILYLSAF